MEYIEDNNLSLEYYDYNIYELDEKLNVNLHEIVMDYYKLVFEYYDIDEFCYTCGEFGHDCISMECIFYNKYYA